MLVQREVLEIMMIISGQVHHGCQIHRSHKHTLRLLGGHTAHREIIFLDNHDTELRYQVYGTLE